jgi:hypothetical protein
METTNDRNARAQPRPNFVASAYDQINSTLLTQSLLQGMLAL